MDDYKKNLRGGNIWSKTNWTMEQIKSGFIEFYIKYGHYPTAPEIDKFEFLPSARSIQRSYGGVKKIRSELGLNIGYTDCTSGKIRSKMASKINKRGMEAEKEIEKLLIEHFGKEFVHIEKPFGTSKERLDFYIFSKNYEFGVDVFFPNSFENLTKIVNSKQKKYGFLNFDLYMISMNHELDQGGIDTKIMNKKIKISNNIKVLNKNNFISGILKLERLKILK